MFIEVKTHLKSAFDIVYRQPVQLKCVSGSFFFEFYAGGFQEF